MEKIILPVVLTIAAIFVSLLVFLFINSVDIQYVVGLDTQKAVLVAPGQTYALQPSQYSDTNFRFSRYLILCNETSHPSDPQVCLNGVGISNRGYLMLTSGSKKIDPNKLAVVPGKSFYQLDDGQKQEIKINIDAPIMDYRVYANFLLPDPLSVYADINTSYYRGTLSPKVKTRVDKARNQRHRYQIHFVWENEPYQLDLIFHLSASAKGLVFNRSSRWIKFEVPFPEF